MSIGPVAIVTDITELSRDTPVFTYNLSSPTSMGLYVSNLVPGILNSIELDLVYNFFISCSIGEISWAKVQYADVGHQPEIFQQWIKM